MSRYFWEYMSVLSGGEQKILGHEVLATAAKRKTRGFPSSAHPNTPV